MNRGSGIANMHDRVLRRCGFGRTPLPQTVLKRRYRVLLQSAQAFQGGRSGYVYITLPRAGSPVNTPLEKRA